MQWSIMKLLFLVRLIPIVASGRGNRHLRAGLDDGSTADKEYTLMQFNSEYCKSETYICLSLTEGQFTRKNLPEGRTPEILCDKLNKEDEDGNFVIDSCPGTEADGCPTDKCKNCTEDAVKHFALDQCNGGWMLKKGKPEGFNCVSTDNVDLGLARWCDRWPTSSSDIKPQLDGMKASVALKAEAGEESSGSETDDKVNEVGISCNNVTVALNGGSAYDKMNTVMKKYLEAAEDV